VAAISVAGPAYRVRAGADQLGVLVAETAAAISRRLGHR
jgi:DNA-binding IclR family transcriptional regulator